MQITALLTGRGNNTLKDKNLLSLNGHPLLHYPANAAKNSKLITETKKVNAKLIHFILIKCEFIYFFYNCNFCKLHQKDDPTDLQVDRIWYLLHATPKILLWLQHHLTNS